MTDAPIDLDALLAEVRERVKQKRERGVYGPEVDALLRAELPGGGRLLTEDIKDPVGALAQLLDEDAAYDPTSKKRLIGPFVTFARRGVIWLIRWWIGAIVDRQDRINRLLAAAIDAEGRLAPRFGERLERLERELERRREHEVASNLHSGHFQARFGGTEDVVRAQSELFVDLFKGRARVLDIGSGRGPFLELLRDRGIGGYGVDLDPRMVELSRERGFEVFEADAASHLHALPAASIDGVFARHVAEHVLPGDLVEMLRELRRVLRPGSPIVFITPNVATLTVGATTFWNDPSHLRPIPPDLFEFYLMVEGFERVTTRTFEASTTRLAEDLDDPRAQENARLLNTTLFGDRDYAVVGYQPEG
ncbi:MAG: class I SAM-dependent methyltransferase [Chloroflexota bacterium]|nr:class I SAM-dependent methyltransferase [Chloroflexota bacterium]